MAFASRFKLLAAASAGAAAWILQPEPAQASSVVVHQRDELKLVQIVFRHGARSPLGKKYWPELVDAWDVCGTEYDGVPLNITTVEGAERPVNEHDKQQVETVFKGGCRKGELTRIGQRQALQFGQWLRQRYVEEVGFLPPKYEDGTLLARSTNYSRTIATLRGVLTGLYPKVSTPVPVHTTEELDEILFANIQSCERLGQLLKEIQAQATKTSVSPPPHVADLVERVRAALGIANNGDPINFIELHDAVTTMSTHGKKQRLPKELQNEAVQKEIELQATNRFLSFIAPHQHTGRQEEVLRLGMGRLMELMIQRMDQASSSGAPHKMYFYSGHDSTIMPLLAALIGHVDHWPTYLSNLVFELWERPSGEHYVRVLYNTEELPLPCRFCNSSKAEVDLEQFRHHILGPFLMSKDVQAKECAVLHFSHDLPAGEHVTKVKIGSSIEDEEQPSTTP